MVLERQCAVQDLSIYRLAPCTENCSQNLSKTFSLKDLEDISYFRNFEPENKKLLRLLCVLSKISEMATDWLQAELRFG